MIPYSFNVFLIVNTFRELSSMTRSLNMATGYFRAFYDSLVNFCLSHKSKLTVVFMYVKSEIAGLFWEMGDWNKSPVPKLGQVSDLLRKNWVGLPISAEMSYLLEII